MGFDPSLTHFGYVVLDQNGTVAKRGVLACKLRGMERIAYLITEVVRLLTEMKACARWQGMKLLIAREDYAFAASSGSDAVLKEFGGILEWTMHGMRLPLNKLNIATVKKFVTGKGNAQKDQMMLSVYKNFGFDPADENEADAYGVAVTARAIYLGSTKEMTAAQREVVASAVKKGDNPVLAPDDSRPR